MPLVGSWKVGLSIEPVKTGIQPGPSQVSNYKAFKELKPDGKEMILDSKGR